MALGKLARILANAASAKAATSGVNLAIKPASCFSGLIRVTAFAPDASKQSYRPSAAQTGSDFLPVAPVNLVLAQHPANPALVTGSGFLLVACLNPPETKSKTYSCSKL